MLALLLAFASTTLTACRSTPKDGRNQEKNVFEQLTDADLSPPPRGRRTRNSALDPEGSDDFYENYPGDERSTRGGRTARTARPGAKGVTEVGEGYELNFSNASLPELTKVILKDTLKIPYVYDARVQGTVTLSTGRAVSREELLTALESVLQMNRGALVKQGDGYRVVAESALKKGGAGAVDYVSEARRVGPGYGITIFPLQHVSAQTMLRTLSAFVAKTGALRADVRNNLLIVRGTGSERRTLMQVASQLDADWIRGQSVGIYPLRHAMPDEIIEQLEKIFQTDTGGLGKNVVRFQPMKRLRAVLVMTNRSSQLRQVETWVRRLDRTSDASIRSFVYHVENGKAKDLAKVLNDVFGGESSRSRDAGAEVAPDEDVAVAEDAASETEGDQAAAEADPDATASISATSIPASSSSLSGPIRIIADEIKNNVIIRASGHDLKKIKAVLRDLDRPAAQVIINATLAEVTLNDNLRYGVQVFLRNRENNPDVAGGFTDSQSLTIAPELPGLNFLVGMQTSPKVVLDALANETSVRVVSSPSVVVLDNQSATLQVGDEVPVATRSAQSVTDPEAPIVNNIEFRDTGVILKVTPRVSSDGLVTMEIEQEISNVTSTTAVGAAGGLTPTISQRRIASTISVQSGQMVVLGGLINERKDSFKNRVPIWEKVPIIGQFPGKTDNALVRTELVVFLRPQIVHNAAEASRIAEEFRARLRSLVPKRKRKYERWPRKKKGWQTTVDDVKN